MKVLRRIVLAAALVAVGFAGYLVAAGMTAGVDESEVALVEVSGARAPRFFELRDIYSLARETIAFPVYLLRSLTES